MDQFKPVLEFLYSYYPLPQEDFQNIMISFILWSLLYAIIAANIPLSMVGKPSSVKLKSNDELDVRNRLVSIVNGITLFICAANLFFRFPGGCDTPNT